MKLSKFKFNLPQELNRIIHPAKEQGRVQN